MVQKHSLPIPASFRLPLFYQSNDTICFTENEDFFERVNKYYFYFDIAYNMDVSLQITPWKERLSFVPQLFLKWKEQREDLSSLFRSRIKAKSFREMKVWVSLFISSLFWTNKQPVKNIHIVYKQVGELDILPVNCVERLSFIIENHTHYHSFIQLTELFTELEKQFYIHSRK